jgi:pyruvate dehydrogenase E1 component
VAGRPVGRHRHRRPERAHFLLEQLLEHARQSRHRHAVLGQHRLRQHHRAEQEERPPGNLELEGAPARLHALERDGDGGQGQPPAPRADGGDLGGHISSFQSLAHMFGAGFNHFWHAESEGHGGDLLYIQGHSAPGIYARAYLEGRISEEQLLNFRQEVDGKGCRATRTRS